MKVCGHTTGGGLRTGGINRNGVEKPHFFLPFFLLRVFFFLGQRGKRIAGEDNDLTWLITPTTRHKQ